MQNTRENKITFILFIIMMIGLFLPLFQQFAKIVEVKPLLGAVELEKRPTRSIDSWIDESFQESSEKYLNQEFGFRNWFVKLHNQIEFSLFDATNAHSVVIGKDNYLYEENYIKAYYGRDFIGDSAMQAKVNRIKFLQDTLESLNKELLVVIAPGKSTFYPEYIPEHLKSEKSRTNLEAFLDLAKEDQLQLIDFNTWFVDQKEKSDYPLYPKTGIHWSRYAMNLVIDSLLSYIEEKRNIDLPDVNIGQIQISKNLIDPDRDIEDGMNLLFDIRNQPMANADISYNETGKVKPKAIVISDSFFWGLYGKGILKHAFNNGEFWFYNREIHTPDGEGPGMVSEVDYFSKIMKTDIIILMTTDANLPKFPWGFDESATYALNNLDEYLAQLKKREEKINGYVSAIKASPDWLLSTRNQALDKNISLDSMILLNAIYMVENE